LEHEQKAAEDVNESPTKDELMQSLEKMIGKIELPKNKKRFANYNKTLQLKFTDNSDVVCHIIFNEGTATIVEGVDENAELMITTTTEMIMAILDGSLSPTRAFIAGKVKAKGPPNDLMKLQALMK
jgi:putative sterol carrier protein